MKPPLSSSQNPKLKKWKALFEDAAARREEGLFILEGPKLVQDALASPLKGREACAVEGFEDQGIAKALAAAQVPLNTLSKAAFRKLSDTESPQGIFLVAEIPKPPKDSPEIWAALDGIQDPGNVGMMLRSACAVGAAVVLGKGCADPWAPKAVRAAAGAQMQVALTQSADLPAWLRAFQGTAWALDSHAGSSLAQVQLKGKACFVVGAEGRGLSPEVRAACAQALHLDYPGPMESLNAGVSLSLALFEALRQKNI